MGFAPYQSSFTIYTQPSATGEAHTILYLGDGQYAIRVGDDVLPQRWDRDDFDDCVREYTTILGEPLRAHEYAD